MIQESNEEGDVPSDTDEYVDQSPDGRWFRRDDTVSTEYTCYIICLIWFDLLNSLLQFVCFSMA